MKVTKDEILKKKSFNVANGEKKENPVIFAWLASVDIYVGIV